MINFQIPLESLSSSTSITQNAASPYAPSEAMYVHLKIFSFPIFKSLLIKFILFFNKIFV